MKHPPPDPTELHASIVAATTAAKRAVGAMRLATLAATQAHDDLIRYAASFRREADREQLVEAAQRLLFAAREFNNTSVQIGAIYKQQYRPLRAAYTAVLRLLGYE